MNNATAFRENVIFHEITEIRGGHRKSYSGSCHMTGRWHARNSTSARRRTGVLECALWVDQIVPDWMRF